MKTPYSLQLAQQALDNAPKDRLPVLKKALDIRMSKAVYRMLHAMKVPDNGLLGLLPIMAHSGGKDSVLTLHCCNKAFGADAEFGILHNTKPEVTHPSTVQFLYQLNRPVIYCSAKDMPRMVLRERSAIFLIDGTRRDEAGREDGRSTDFISQGKSLPRTELPLLVKEGTFGCPVLYPLYDWTDEEVWLYIALYRLPVSEEYSNGT